jgi:prolyl 4-hydroxylase
MLDAGWLAISASLALRLTDEENAAFGVPLLAEQLKSSVALPLPVLDTDSNMSDAGDKWVQVLAHQNDLQEAVFGNLLSSAECDALIEQAKARLLPTSVGESDRNCQSMLFERSENAVLQRIEARIAKLLNWPAQNGEGLQILHYSARASDVLIQDSNGLNKPALNKSALNKPALNKSALNQPLEAVASAGMSSPPARGGRRVASVAIYLSQPDAECFGDWKTLEATTQLRRGNAVFESYPSSTLNAALPHSFKLPQDAVWIAIKRLREREIS